MTERRYDDDEIRKILARATELRPESDAGSPIPGLLQAEPDPSGQRGLTITELEAVAEKAGIPASRIVEAVAEFDLDRSLDASGDTHFGAELGARHDVLLSRLLTESEWDRFVVQLRDVFGTSGTVRSEGSLRTWTGDGATVLLEPLDDGARLRFESRDSSSKSLVDGGVALVGSAGIMGVLLGILVPVSGKPLPGILLATVLAILGFGAGLWALGRHAASTNRSKRGRDFSRIGAEARRIAGAERDSRGP